MPDVNVRRAGASGPTSVGAALSLGYAVISRRINRRQILESLSDTVSTCGSLLLVGVGAAMLTKMLSMTGLGLYISQIIGAFNFDYWQLMLMIVAIYLVLGMFLDPFGAMLITLPVFLPILHHYHVDLIFFGVFLVKMLEIGMITPPVGINVYVIKSVVGDLTSLNGVFKGIGMFFVTDILVIGGLIFFPSLFFLPVSG